MTMQCFLQIVTTFLRVIFLLSPSLNSFIIRDRESSTASTSSTQKELHHSSLFLVVLVVMTIFFSWFYLLFSYLTHIWLAILVQTVNLLYFPEENAWFWCVHFLKCPFEFNLSPHRIGFTANSHASNIASSGDHSLKCHYK